MTDEQFENYMNYGSEVVTDIYGTEIDQETLEELIQD